MGRLGERVAIVTGGAGGIGSVVARALAAEGASVMIADVRDAEGKDLAADLGHPARFGHLDVTSEDDWQRALADTERELELGPVAVLASIAGIIDWGPMEEQSPASFRRVVDVNLTGAWPGMRAVAPSLRRAGGGVIVNMSSLAGLTAYAGVGAYAASKGLASWTRPSRRAVGSSWTGAS
ncbi:SDR family NAD(P)-dependent oxidoreductase [Streptomyces iakyrus]|uniref:SDR family NAD(P)-dependent oxidoreductase n=1 Tax=Streptomyces iakyrus TaxID=68219 RepID=UPI0036B79C62